MSKKLKTPRATYIAIDNEFENIIFMGDLDIVLQRVEEYLEEAESEAADNVSVYEIGNEVNLKFSVKVTVKQ